MKHTKTFLFTTFALFLLAASLFAAYTTLPKYLDLDLYKNNIEKEIESAIGVPVSIGKINITVKGGVGLEIREVTLKGGAGGMLRIKKGVLSFKLLPLITKGAIELKKLEIHSPEIVVVRDKNGTIDFILKTGAQDSLQEKDGFKLSGAVREKIADFLRSYIFIRDGTIHFIDNLGFKKPVETTLNHIDLSIRTDYFRNNAAVNIRLALPWEKEPAELSFKGEVSKLFRKEKDEETTIQGKLRLRSLPFKFLQPYLKKFFPQKDLNVRLEGMASIKASMDGDIESTGKIESSKFNNGIGDSLISFSYMLNVKDNKMQIKKMELKSGPVSLTGKAIVSNIAGPSPDLYFNVATSDIDVRWLKKNLIKGVIPEPFTKYLKEHADSGKVKILDLSFIGPFKKILAPAEVDNIKLFNAAVSLNKLALKKLPVIKSATHINGLIVLSQGNVSLKDISFVMLKSHVKNVSGNIKDILNNTFAQLSVDADLDLSQLPEIAKELGSGEWFQGLKKGGGSVEVKIKYKGLLKENLLPNLKGEFVLNNAEIIHEKINLPLTKINGAIFLTSERVELKGLKWRSGLSRFSVDGFIFQLKSETPIYDLQVKTVIDARTIKEMKWIKTDNLAFHDGKALGDFLIQGKKERLLIVGETNLSDMTLSFLKSFKKERGVDTKLKFSGFLTGDTYTIKKMTYKSGESSLRGKGEVTFTGKEPYSIEVESKNIRPVDLFPLMPEIDAKEVGNVRVKGKIFGEATNAWGVQIIGNLELSNTTLNFVESGKEIKDLNAVIAFKGSGLDFKSFNFLFENGKIEGEGSLQRYRFPQVKLDLKADSFNFDSILGDDDEDAGKEEGRKEEEEKEPQPEKNSLSYEVVTFMEVKKGTYKALPFSNMTMNLTVNKKEIKANPFFVDAFDGKFIGTWRVQRGKIVGFSIQGDVKDVDIVKFCEKMPTDIRSIEGKADVNVNIYGKGETLEEYRRSLVGKTSFRLRDGKLDQMPILSKIFSFLNFKFKVPNFQTGGMTYNYITGDADIKNGIAKSDNFLIDTDSVRMTGVGQVDIGNATVDMIVGAQPFQTIDKVLTKIPIIGHVLTGDEESFIVSHYSVKGPLEKPEVDAMTLKSVGKGVYGIIKRILTIPVDLIKGK